MFPSPQKIDIYNFAIRVWGSAISVVVNVSEYLVLWARVIIIACHYVNRLLKHNVCVFQFFFYDLIIRLSRGNWFYKGHNLFKTFAIRLSFDIDVRCHSSLRVEPDGVFAINIQRRIFRTYVQGLRHQREIVRQAGSLASGGSKQHGYPKPVFAPKNFICALCMNICGSKA